MITSTMAYLAYISNWLSLTIALRWNYKPNTCRGRCMKNFKWYLYVYITIFIIIFMTISLVNCDTPQPYGVSIAFQLLKIGVLILAAIVGPLFLITLKRNSNYLYKKTKLKV